MKTAVTTTTPARSGATPPAAGASAPAARVLAALGGAALAVGPLLIAGGTVTSPPQNSGSTADYIESLARDPFVTGLSATLFHYGWVAFALGALAAIGLLRGPRGRTLTIVGGLLTAFTAMQISGLLLADWFNGSLGRHLPIAQAAAVSDGATGDPGVHVWLLTGQLAIVAPIVLWAGLARARALSWWLVPLGLLPLVVLPFVLPLIGGLTAGPVGTGLSFVVAAATFAPAYVTAVRLVRTARRAV